MGVPPGAAGLGRRHRRRRHLVGGAAHARLRHAARPRGRGLRRRGAGGAYRRARGREPVLHRGDDRHADARGAPAAAARSRPGAPPVARVRPGGHRRAPRPPVTGSEGARPARLRLPTWCVRARGTRPDRRPQARRAGRARGGGVPAPGRGAAVGVAVPLRRPARRRVRGPREARAAAAAPARGEPARRAGDGRAVPQVDRVPPRAGGPGGAGPQPEGPRAGRARGGGAHARRRPRAQADRVAGSRRPLRTRARDGGPRVRLGRARGSAPVADGRGPLLAGRVRGRRDHAAARARRRPGQRAGARARLPLPRATSR